MGKKQKILYLDTETTGLDPEKNDIIQIAGIVEIDGEVKEKFNIFCQPYSYENISEEALVVHGKSITEMKEWQNPERALGQFVEILDKYIDKYAVSDKFFVAGQNVSFDVDFLYSWAKKGGNKYIGSYIWRNVIDLKTFTSASVAWGICNFKSLKLKEVCDRFGIELKNAHNAMADIEATRLCLLKFKDFLFYGLPGNKR